MASGTIIQFLDNGIQMPFWGWHLKCHISNLTLNKKKNPTLGLASYVIVSYPTNRRVSPS